MGVTVNKPGICTTIQDLGRRGYLGSGFSPSGVMDKRAARIANLLVDNGENAPVLEFCLAGPTLRFTTNTCIALTGGNFSPTVDGAAIPMYAAIMVHRGSVLEFGAPKNRCLRISRHRGRDRSRSPRSWAAPPDQPEVRHRRLGRTLRCRRATTCPLSPRTSISWTIWARTRSKTTASTVSRQTKSSCA